MLLVRNLTKRFNDVKVVDNLSFSINPSEIYALIGPNGAGKTTTIKTILGLYSKDSGEITLFNSEIANDESEVRSKIGYIPDEPVFYPFLTGFEVLDFVRNLYKISPKDYKKRLEEMLAIYPIGSTLSDYPENYSRGNKQKLSIISSFMHRPKLLLIDEPIVGLDPQSCEKTSNLFSDFAKKGGMILMSTHTLSFVDKVAVKIGVLDHGKLICEGSKSDLIKKAGNGQTLFTAYMHLVKA